MNTAHRNSGNTVRMTVPTRALTLHRPWPYAILEHGKRTENRPWAPSRPPGPVALHAGKTVSDPIVQLFEEITRGPLPRRALHTGIVGFARIDSIHHARECPRTESCRIWGTEDGYHWMLSRVQRLTEPVPAPGRQRLWVIPDQVAARLQKVRAVPGR